MIGINNDGTNTIPQIQHGLGLSNLVDLYVSPRMLLKLDQNPDLFWDVMWHEEQEKQGLT